VYKTAFVKIIKGSSENVFGYGIRVNNSQGTENKYSLSRDFRYKKASKLKYIQLLAI
jgi:hypothetical protein